ncbi:DUF7173 family protein [Psychrobacter pygoscelis]|uniref:DUF7173 family protein n=1 Tax=Psychrobacter pygoscelis TaxID=2488563 RepID=UPI00103DE623|nr:hypothetical protein [Psychrobacter pygoscelis]
MNAFITQSVKATNANPALAASALANSHATAQAPVTGSIAEQAPNDLDLLAEEWQSMKDLEAQAKERRYEIEQEIITLVGVLDEGTTNEETDCFKVKTVGKLTRSLDDKAIQADWDNLPSEVKQCFKFKASLDTKNLRALEAMRSDLVPVMAKYITTKPAKPSVLVEVK